MTGPREDSPPEEQGAPVSDWDKAIAEKAGPKPDPKPDGGEQAPRAAPAVDESPFPSTDALEQEQVADLKHTRNLREIYADKAYALAFSCLWGWAGMLVAAGLVNGWRGDPLWSDKVLIAVTTGVTVSVLAVFLGVIRGLFPNGNGSASKGK